MSLPSWLPWTFSRSRGRCAKRRHQATTLHHRRHTFRPSPESLETRLTPSLSTLASFGAPNGANPAGALIMDSSGNLYGTTSAGGAFNEGTVFEVAHGSGAITTLASFNGSNGAGPDGPLIMDSSGNLYGTTQGGGASGDGTVFELVHGSGTITTLASFNGTDGAGPDGPLIIDSSGNLYGTTLEGGASGDGTVFELVHGSGTITTLASFNGTNGEYPHSGVIMDGSGNLYGTTADGGASGDGTVFKLAKGSGTITTLASFNGANGSSPEAGLIMDSSGNLYGTTASAGASDYGTVFELAKGSGTITTLASFNGSNGAHPYDALLMDGSGNLYGTTETAGASIDGTVFELAKGSGTITALASFDGGNGANPDSSVVMDSSGNLYGTAAGGGPYGEGTVFELAQGSGAITALASFYGTGAGPYAGVIMDSSGNLYGTTLDGGASDDGTVFELAAGSGTITTLASFNGSTVRTRMTALIQTAAATSMARRPLEARPTTARFSSWPHGSGTITTLASFNGTNGADALWRPGHGQQRQPLRHNDTASSLMSPRRPTTARSSRSPRAAVRSPRWLPSTAPTVLTPKLPWSWTRSGNLYGTTKSGSVFEVVHGSGTITTLGTLGAPSYAGLLMDSSGNLYGTTYSGGASHDGSIFEVAKGGRRGHTLTTLASFNGTNGAGAVWRPDHGQQRQSVRHNAWMEAPPVTARFSSWPMAAARSRRWLRSTAATVPTRMPASSWTAAAICTARRTTEAPTGRARFSSCQGPLPRRPSRSAVCLPRPAPAPLRHSPSPSRMPSARPTAAIPAPSTSRAPTKRPTLLANDMALGQWNAHRHRVRAAKEE